MNIQSQSAFACGRACRAVAAACMALVATAGAPDAIAAPAAGDHWSYRVINGYNGEVRGSVRYRVERIDAAGVAVAVTSDTPALGAARSEIYTPEGNWVKHALINHDQPVEYQFAQPYPAYVFPLDSGQSWSQRVDATRATGGRRASVRVDGEVVGTERVTVPAGSYDTIKVKRRIYAGDFDGSRSETNITETEWYAPALGRAVRAEVNSNFMDQSLCGDEMSACRPRRGDWHIFELLDAGSAKK
jgi:hypothetical protein